MYQVKSLDLGSVALYSFLIFFILGLLFCLPVGCFGFLFSNFAPGFSQDEMGDMGPNPLQFMRVLGGFFMIVMPILYGIMGAFVNTILALIYNLLSMKFGGIKVQLEKVENMQIPGAHATLTGRHNGRTDSEPQSVDL